MSSIEQQSRIDHLTTCAHHGAALFAGFIIGYGILSRDMGVSSAMTLNLIELVMAVMGRNLTEVLIRVVGLAIYCSAVVTFTVIRLRTDWNREYISLGIDLAGVILLTMLPKDLDPVIACYPMFFALSFQYNAFPGCYGYGASTVFNSNNTRMTTVALTEYALNRDAESLRRGLFFLWTIACFHLGIVLSWLGMEYLGQYSVVIALGILGGITCFSVRKTRILV